MKRKWGFTLIELLAVIVILAVIALIATPLVLNIIERAEKGAFKDSVYGIMEAAEFQVILDDSKYPITYVFPEDGNKIKFKGTKPSEGYIQIVTEGKIKLALGNGRWCAVKEVDDSQVTIKNGKCEKIDLNRPILSGYGDLNQQINVNETYTMPTVTAQDKDGNKLNVTTIMKQGDKVVDSIDTSSEGIYTITYTTEADKDGNTSSVTVTIQVIKQETDTDKVIESGSKDGGLELIGDTYYYRGESPKNWVQFDGVTGDDSIWRIISIESGIMKIIRNTPITGQAWDTSNSNVWTRPATINTYLNETYKNSLSTMIQNKIQLTSFYIGIVTWNTGVNVTTIKSEERKVTPWKGYVGLMNASDYIYASKNDSCMTSGINNMSCGNENWLYDSAQQWTINATSSDISHTLYVFGSGQLSRDIVSSATLTSRPVIHLRSDIKIVSGEGTEENPYKIQK